MTDFRKLVDSTNTRRTQRHHVPLDDRNHPAHARIQALRLALDTRSHTVATALFDGKPGDLSAAQEILNGEIR